MPDWLNTESWNLALFMAVIAVAMLGGIHTARLGRLGSLRRMPGVEAIEGAVARAAETGRPVFYVPGVRDLDDTQTIASLSILGPVAETVARHDCELVLPTDRSLVMAAARETCRQSFLAAGRGAAFREDMVSYISDEQFAFVAQVDGMIARRRPAACLLLGSFYAESLLLAEAGQIAGAVQIAGTAGWHQLPFLIAACDHVLIGEELYAASAYLTRDPMLLGSLRGQDVVKYLTIAFLIGGSLMSTLAVLTDATALRALHEAVLQLLEVR